MLAVASSLGITIVGNFQVHLHRHKVIHRTSTELFFKVASLPHKGLKCSRRSFHRRRVCVFRLVDLFLDANNHGQAAQKVCFIIQLLHIHVHTSLDHLHHGNTQPHIQ